MLSDVLPDYRGERHKQSAAAASPHAEPSSEELAPTPDITSTVSKEVWLQKILGLSLLNSQGL